MRSEIESSQFLRIFPTYYFLPTMVYYDNIFGDLNRNAMIRNRN